MLDKKLQAIIAETLRDLQDLRDRRELWWDAVVEVMRNNDALEESGDGKVDREDNKHMSANNVLKIDGSPSGAVVNEVCMLRSYRSHRYSPCPRPSYTPLMYWLLPYRTGQGVV